MSSIKLVGVSAGRKGRITESAVEHVLKSTGEEYELFSLSSFELLTCDACLACVQTNRCIKQDRLNEILDAMVEADGLVFGAPEYWDGANAKARAFWERVAFSGLHNEYLPMKGKPIVSIGVFGSGGAQHVLKDLRMFYDDASLWLVDEVQVQGEYACFSCGKGSECMVGGFVKLYSKGTPVTEERKPSIRNQHPEKSQNCQGYDIRPRLEKAGQRLRSYSEAEI